MNCNLGKTGYRNVEQILCLHPKKTEKLELGLPISVDKATTVYVPIKKSSLAIASVNSVIAML
ncbi:hypothetical protein GS682_09935 [Nostoc sp. B(2019)]|nr:hypothetical protein [Nostoc sp. B(2019)]